MNFASNKLQFLILLFILFGIPVHLSGKEYSFDQYYLIDSTKRLTREDLFLKSLQGNDILNPSLQKLKPGEVLTLGYIQYDIVIWVVTVLKEKTQGNEVVVVERPSMDSLEVFAYGGGKLLSSSLTGDLVSFYSRYYKANYLNVLLPPGTDKIICRAVNAGGFNFPTHILDESAFFDRYDFNDIMFALYFGFVFFVIIANIFLYTWLRESIYIYYVLATLASALLIAVEYGYMNRFAWPGFPVINAYIPGIYGSMFLVALFNEKFLSIRERLPLVHKLYYMVYALYFVGVIVSLSGNYHYSMEIGAFTGGFLVPALSLLSGVYILHKYKIKEVRYFILAWTCYFGFFMIYALSARGIVSHSFLSTNSLMIGSGLELIFFFLAVVNKIEVLRHEKEKLLSQQKEHLDVLVNQRTEELNRKNQEILEQHELIENQNRLLKDAKNSLEQMVDEQTQNLIEANLELLATNNRLEQFAYVSAHNLRGPVATLKGLVSLYNQNDVDDEMNRYVIEKSDLTIDKLDSIIKDLAIVLECSNQKNESHEEVNLMGVLDECKQQLRPEIMSSGIVINTDLTYSLFVHSLPSYIHNIFYHLISNSIRFHSKSVTPELFIHVDIKHEGFTMVFKDNGIGMDMEMIGDKVFKPFKRFHYERSGRGLGLYQIKAQVESLKGRISLKSVLNEGTEVEIFIPKR